MYSLILLFPIISVVIVGFFGRYLGKKGSMLFANVCIFFTFLLACLMFFEVNLSGITVYIILGKWFSIDTTTVYWSFLFDSVTCIMLIVITSISSLVHLYSTSYMEHDRDIVRFMALLSLFTFFMIFLVISGNFIQLFMGWEGVGISSFLLINFWSGRLPANLSGIKAILINKIADCGILLAILLLMENCGSFEFCSVFCILQDLDNNILNIDIIELISFGLFIGAVGKSAQLGLHMWLPDAMEGPTPVSALIHAATMVTAGVFVLIRISPMLIYAEKTLFVITILGALTGFVAGIIGIFQNDLKRVIAYSTCSQLGYMVMSCGVTNFSVALFHLMNHAFFKALLFLSAGAIIHAIADQQDMRKMGGLVQLLPMTYSLMLIGSLSLMGFPYTTGYYSKELILELAYVQYSVVGFVSYGLLLIGAGCTAFYSARLIFLTFLSEINIKRGHVSSIHECNIRMGLPMLLLGFGSIFFGYLFKDMFIGMGTPMFSNSLGESLHSFMYSAFLDAEFLNVFIKLIPIGVSIFLGFLSILFYKKYLRLFSYVNKIFLYVYNFFNKKLYFDIIINKFFVFPILKFGNNITFMLLDRGIIEIFGPTGIVRIIVFQIKFFIQHISGFIYQYVFLIILSILVMLGSLRYLNLDENLDCICVYGYISYVVLQTLTINNNKKEYIA